MKAVFAEIVALALISTITVRESAAASKIFLEDGIREAKARVLSLLLVICP